MTDKDPNKDKHQGHLVLLAKDNDGYRNLIKIVSAGYIKGYYYKPRIDKEALRQHSEGSSLFLPASPGTCSMRCSWEIMRRRKERPSELLEIFGDGNFYLEIQDQGLEERPESSRIC